MLRRLVIPIIVCAISVSCGRAPQHPDGRQKLAVSIAPLGPLIDSLTCGDFEIAVLVPPGESPETFSPDPHRMKVVEDARIYFGIGPMDFERELTGRLARGGNFVRLADGVELLGGDSSGRGADPHIWLSPEALKTMMRTALNAVMRLYPDSVKYERAYSRIYDRLDSLDRAVRRTLADSPRRSFVVYHPALGYYARDYGLREISIETHGKDPTPTGIRRVIREAAADSVRYVLYQKEYPAGTAETVAAEIGASPAEIDPLSDDIVGQICRITRLIAAP